MKKYKRYFFVIFFVLVFLVTRFYKLNEQLIWEDNFSWHYRINYYPWIIENNLKGRPEPAKDLKYAGTLSYHPGVTIMDFSGMTMRIWKKVYTKINPDYVPCGFADINCPFLKTEMVVAKVPIILLSAVAMGLSFYLVQKNFGLLTAVIFGAFAMFEPLFSFSSRDLHLDYLQASLLIATALLVIDNTASPAHAGLSFGLAVLTRFVSLAVAPVFALLFVLKKDFKKLFIFAAITLVVFIVLYPPMWVAPVNTIKYIISGSVGSTTSHNQNIVVPGYFAGLKVYFDQFMQFFSVPYKLASVTTLALLPFLVLKSKQKRYQIIIILVIGLSYILFINISDKRFIRYLTFSLMLFCIIFGQTLDLVSKALLKKRQSGLRTTSINTFRENS